MTPKEYLHPPFPWVAFLGPDGSGKSSVLNGVEEKLRAQSLSLHLIHWSPHLLRPKRPVLGGVVTDPHAKPPRNLPFSLLKLAELMAEWWLAWPCALRRPRATQFLFSDRYYADLLVDRRRYRFSAAAVFLAKIAFRFLPKPDRVIILAGDPATIHARKQEVPLEEMERQIAGYRELAAWIGPRAVVLDACRPLSEVVEAAYAEVMRVYRPTSP